MAPNISPTFKPSELGTVEIISPDTIAIKNKAILSGVELEHIFNDNLYSFTIKSRNKKPFTVAMTSGGEFKTVPIGCEFYLEGLKLTTTTIYINSSYDDVLEIVETFSL